MTEWLPLNENVHNLHTVALEVADKHGIARIIGYDGILKGDQVLYNGETYTVVMVSRLGHMGLSKTGSLPYTESVYPRDLTKVEVDIVGKMAFKNSPEGEEITKHKFNDFATKEDKILAKETANWDISDDELFE